MNLEELEKRVDKIEKRLKSKETCPSCGFCPVCGRRNAPSFYPVMPYPNLPWIIYSTGNLTIPCISSEQLFYAVDSTSILPGGVT